MKTTSKCGRCGAEVPADTITTTGPYQTCADCTPVIRG